MRAGSGGDTSPGGQTLVAAGPGGTTSGDGGLLVLRGGEVQGTGVGGNVSIQTSAQEFTTPVDRYLVNAASKALTNTTATDLFTATVASNTMIGGAVNLTVRATDATDYQATTVTFTYAAINVGGTVTNQVTLNASSTSSITSTGTLTVTATATNGAGSITVQVTATSSLTPTTLDATYQVINNSGQAIAIV